MNWNQRLTQARSAQMIKKSALATMLGVSPATISQWESGVTREIKGENLTNLCRILKVTPDWLLHGVVDQQPDGPAAVSGAMDVAVEDEDSSAFYQIPRVELKLQAGINGVRTEPDSSEGGRAPLSRVWVDERGFDAARLIAIRIKGESMEPTLYGGDTVYVNLADRRLVDNAVYAVNYEGEAVVKRLARDAGQWWLMSDNSDQRKYHRRVCKSGDCEIVGRVIRRESEHF